MSRPRLGWWLLCCSVAMSVVLGWRLYVTEIRRDAEGAALLLVVGRCEQRLERYAEVEAIAREMERALGGR